MLCIFFFWSGRWGGCGLICFLGGLGVGERWCGFVIFRIIVESSGFVGWGGWYGWRSGIVSWDWLGCGFSVGEGMLVKVGVVRIGDVWRELWFVWLK